MNKILKNILASKRFAKLLAKRDMLVAKKEAARKALGMTLGQFEKLAKKIDHQVRRINSVLFRAGKIDALQFSSALV